MVFGIGSRPRGTKRSGNPAASRNAPVTIAVLFLAVGSAAICGVCGGALYYFQPHVSEDAVNVQSLMDELLTITIPQSDDAGTTRFAPRGTIEWNLAFMMSLRGVYFETADEEQDGVLIFLEVSGSSMQKPNVRSHVERVLRERDDSGVQLTPTGTAEIRPLSVRGQSVDFTFESGVDPATKARYRLVSGIVLGNRGGDVLIALRVKESPPWDDSVAERMIESIQ